MLKCVTRARVAECSEHALGGFGRLAQATRSSSLLYRPTSSLRAQPWRALRSRELATCLSDLSSATRGTQATSAGTHKASHVKELALRVMTTLEARTKRKLVHRLSPKTCPASTIHVGAPLLFCKMRDTNSANRLPFSPLPKPLSSRGGKAEMTQPMNKVQH